VKETVTYYMYQKRCRIIEEIKKKIRKISKLVEKIIKESLEENNFSSKEEKDNSTYNVISFSIK